MSSTDSTYGGYNYGSLADYFNQSGATKSQGKAGGSGGSAQQYSAPSSSGGSDNTQGGNATSGSNSWISGAVSQTSSDKSTFTTPFSQQFGGITNNQVINSPGATGSTTVSPIAPITGDPSAPGGASGSFNPIPFMLALLAGVALILYVKR